MKQWLTLLILLLGLSASAQFLNATGNWRRTLRENQIQNDEAGNEYRTNIGSAQDKTLLSHSLGGSQNNQRNNDWQVHVQRSDINWHPSLRILVRRTDDGFSTTNGANISGGTGRREITPSSSLFYSGNGNFNDVGIQYRLQGMSVLIPADEYTCTLIYTLIDN